MDSLTKASGVAVSVLVAATASVMLLLPTHPRLRTSRGPAMTPAIMVASATARPPAGQPLVLGGRAAHRCLPPAAPAQDCRVLGDSTGGTRPATAGRRRCRHGPLAAAQPGGTGRAHAGSASAGQCCPGPGRAGPGVTGTGGTGTGSPGPGGAGTGGTGTGVTGPGGTETGSTGRDSTEPGGTGTGGTGTGSAGTGVTGPGGAGTGGADRDGTGRDGAGSSGAGSASASASPGRPAGRSANCLTGIPRRPR
jgi:hypothetical protein